MDQDWFSTTKLQLFDTSQAHQSQGRQVLVGRLVVSGSFWFADKKKHRLSSFVSWDPSFILPWLILIYTLEHNTTSNKIRQ
jgi:hypothetical protein